MKNSIKLLFGLFSISFIGFVSAEEGALPFELFNRLRVEFDDNVRQESSNSDESLKIIEEIELLANLDFNNSYVGLRYSPSFVYWDDREEDDSDIHHQLDAVINHEFTPRLGLSIKETLRISELPELVQTSIDGSGSSLVRENNDFTYNSLSAGVDIVLTDTLAVNLNGRLINLGYEDDAVATRNDYDKEIIGLDLSRRLAPDLVLSLEGRLGSIAYDNRDRNSDSTQLGIGLQAVLNPSLQGNIRVGYENKDYDNALTGSSDSPYFSSELIVTPTAGRSINLGASYAFSESNIDHFVNQERFVVYGGISQDITAKLVANLSASLTTSSYAPDEQQVNGVAAGSDLSGGGDEDFLRVSFRGTYKINRSNWLEAGWQFLDLTSDFGSTREYDQNRFHTGWKTKF